MNDDVELLQRALQWFAVRLTNRPAADFALCNPAGVSLGELLRKQSDEALAGVVRLGLCKKAVVEELLVCRCQRRLRMWFTAFGADEHTANDLVQEICVWMLRGGLDRYDPDRPFASFLCTVARNLYITRVCRPRRPLPAGRQLEKPGHDVTGEAVEVRELSRRIDQAVAELPDQECAIMRLSFQGWSAAEIADHLRVDVTVVYRRLNSARARLQDVLRPQFGPSKRGRPGRTRQAGPTPHPNPLRANGGRSMNTKEDQIMTYLANREGDARAEPGHYYLSDLMDVAERTAAPELMAEVTAHCKECATCRMRIEAYRIMLVQGEDVAELPLVGSLLEFAVTPPVPRAKPQPNPSPMPQAVQPANKAGAPTIPDLVAVATGTASEEVAARVRAHSRTIPTALRCSPSTSGSPNKRRSRKRQSKDRSWAR